MLEKGIEPSRDKSHRILSPSRLPVPTLQHVMITCYLRENRKKHVKLVFVADKFIVYVFTAFQGSGYLDAAYLLRVTFLGEMCYRTLTV